MIRRFLFFALLIFASCRVQQEQMDVQDISAFYDPESPYVESRLWQKKDSLLLLISFDKKEGLNSGPDIKSRYLFYGRTSHKAEGRDDIFLDSVKVSPGTTWETRDQVVLSFKFQKGVPGKLFVLEMYDTRLRELKLFDVPRWQDESIIFLTSGDKPFLRSYLKNTDTVTVKFLSNDVNVRVVKQPLPAATPPFAENNAELPDSDRSFILTTGESNHFSGKDSVRAYIFSGKDTLPGSFLFCGKNNFPEISLPQEMIQPLTYLLPQSDYTLIADKRDKSIIDSVWLTVAGTEERGRELIKGYYGRVVASNHYFTTFREGWKTDRGMLYIILGPPHEVFRHINSEEWVYHEFLGKGSYTFYFERNASGELVLQRKREYEKIWTEAIKQWRSGIIPK